MRDLLIGTVVAVLVLCGAYVSTEMAAGRSVNFQDPVVGNSIDDLIKIARDDTAENQSEAIMELGEKHTELEVTVPVLAQLAMSSRAVIRQSASHALQHIGPKAAPYLKPFFASELQLNEFGQPINLAQLVSDRATGCSAARAIGESCDVYLPQIEELIRSDDTAMRKCGLFALQGMESSAEKLLNEVIVCLEDEDFNNQCSACRILEMLGPKAADAEDELLVILEKGNPSVRGWAAICLGSLGPLPSTPEFATRVAERLKTASPVEAQRLLSGLAKMGPEAKHVAGDVRAKLENWDKFVQAHAAFELWKIAGDEKIAFDTIGSLIRTSGYEQDGLAMAIQMGPDALPLLSAISAHTTSNDPITRELAAAAIGSIGPKAKPASNKLQALLKDSDTMVRVTARQSLNLINSSAGDGKLD